jgi:ATPase family associated with various cellular activities (AAA)
LKGFVMQTLHNDLEKLRKLHELREKAFELRDSGYESLRDIKSIKPGETPTIEPSKYERWVAMGNVLEAATLLKIRRHWRLSRRGTGPSTKLFEDRIGNVDLPSLFSETAERDSTSEQDSNALLDRRIPVLVAALCMELRSERTATVLSVETILCYYRILVEMHLATWPDWTVGAARAGEGSMVTAFVTGESVRGIMAFQRALDSTATFLRDTRFLFERHEVLREMSTALGMPASDHPLMQWSNFALRRMWLDWFIATEPERRAIALPLYDKDQFTDMPTIEQLGKWFRELRIRLSDKTVESAKSFKTALDHIIKHEHSIASHDDESEQLAVVLAKKHARAFGLLVMKTAVKHAGELEEIARLPKGNQSRVSTDDFPEILEKLEAKFKLFSNELGRILDVSKHYVEGAIDRALANPANIDIGELAFAAAAYGSATDWQSKQRLKRVCEILLQSIPPSGLPVTRIPFHSTRRGYKLLPTGCHIVGSLALLLTKTGYEFEPEAVEPLLHAIDSRKIVLHGETAADDTMGWNFDGSSRNSPSVLVTGVTVLALDRMIRMLDARINAIVFDHFTVEHPRRVRERLTLNDLVYPDYGLKIYPEAEEAGKEPMAILLERLRSHLTGVTLPAQPQSVRSSVILHGPPGTGKTTWAEALAESADAPLIRLSPFDLIATPRGPLENVTIQTRARQVFEALSMLTKTVILFDEFEPVFWKRNSGEHSAQPQKNREEIPFLQTGLLPMLVRLHDVAKPQNLVYCLTTNYVDALDDAVTRRGRFDLKLEVNHPDPLSRAGTILFRMASVRRALRKSAPDSSAKTAFLAVVEKEAAIRIVELVKKTRGHATSDLASYFILPPWAKAWSEDGASKRAPKSWEQEAGPYLRILGASPADYDIRPKPDGIETRDLREYEDGVRDATFGAKTAAAILKCLTRRRT